MEYISRLLIIILGMVLIACNGVHIDTREPTIPDAGIADNTLVWNFTSPVIRPGEEVPFAFTNGSGTYTTDPFGIGTFDSTTLIYTPPVNQSPIDHTIGASDGSKVGSNGIKIAGFGTSYRIPFPLSFGDQNYPMSSAVLTNGNLFVSSVIIDSPGWERWVINKSTDNGTTWQQVDNFVPWEVGESHPLAMTSKGNDLYVCGYSWDGNGSGTTWNVRKTTDNGLTWTTSDLLYAVVGDDHICHDITVSAAGNIYAAGKTDTDGGIIKESTDDGATWTTIAANSSVGEFIAIEVAPSGAVWALGKDGHLWKGVYGGSWTWTDVGAVFGTLSYVGYQKVGRIEIVSETEAYIIGNDPSWKIVKTTDGWTTWGTVYTGATARYKGLEIKSLASGEVLATGYVNPAVWTDPTAGVILQSSDNGATWIEVYNSTTPSQEGALLTKLNDGNVLATISMENSPYQYFHLHSTDAGSTWTQRSTTYYQSESLWTYLNDFKKDGAGNLWATAYVNYTDSNYTTTWAVMKSSDGGVTWSESNVTTDIDHTDAGAIGVGPNNEVYVMGDGISDQETRKTTDGGNTWTVVDTNVGHYWPYSMAVTPDGTAFATMNTAGNPVLRKGTTNGTVWSTILNFPIEAGHTNARVTDLEAFADGSLWVGLRERDASSLDNTVIYRSTDGGTSFTEVYRLVESGWYYEQDLRKLSNGDIIAHTMTKVISSSDNGATWQEIYDGSSVGVDIRSYTFDSLNRLYVLHENDQIFTQNQFTGTWFKMFDYPLLNTLDYAEITRFVDCGNSSGVCILTEYAKSVDGAVIEITPLVIP